MASFLQALTDKASSLCPSTTRETVPTSATNIQAGTSVMKLADRDSDQPSVETLERYGIKVRDFAYESTLHPIAPVYFLPKQIQPDPGVSRPEPRRPQLPSSMSSGHASVSESGLNRSTIEKKPTIPGIQLAPLVRQRGFSTLPDYHLDANGDDSHSQQLPWPYSDSHPYSQYSQNEDYINTPVVTPNGSLQWQVSDMNDNSASQSEGEPPGESSPSSVKPQIAVAQENSANKDQVSMISSPSSLTAPSSFSVSPQASSRTPAQKTMTPKCRTVTRSSRSPSPSSRPLSPATPPASRYYLRKRPARHSPTSTSRPVTRSRPAQSILSPPLRSERSAVLSVRSSSPLNLKQVPSSRDSRKRLTGSQKRACREPS
ncbi:hypothetical protein AX17_001334 [Amanita inopinata Kibby_2008]|nr:hypothetical protein AX17_001334 [Amanita inopinata Kibby_2008]